MQMKNEDQHFGLPSSQYKEILRYLKLLAMRTCSGAVYLTSQRIEAKPKVEGIGETHVPEDGMSGGRLAPSVM